MVNDQLYCKGKDLVLRRAPTEEEIPSIISSYHDGTCGGHFAHDLTTRKILQAGFVWPSLHLDEHHHCKTCKVCQETRPRKLTHEPQTPIMSYGPFEKWRIDAIGPFPTTQGQK